MTATSAPQHGLSGATLIAILVAVTSVSPLAISIVVPSLPSIRLSLDADLTIVQMVLSGYLFALALGQLFVGPLADRFGRRPVLIGGFILFLLAGIGCAYAPSIEFLVAGRILQGLGGSAGVVVSRAVVRDLHGRDRAASTLGYVTMGMAVAPMVGPMIGGMINDAMGWQAVFLFLVSVSVLVLIVVWFTLPETNPGRNVQSARTLARDSMELMRIPAFWAYTFTAATTGGVYFSFLAGAPFIASEQLGLGPAQIGALLLFASLGYFAGNFLSGRYAQRLGVMFMIFSGSGVLLATGALITVMAAVGFVNAWSLFTPMVLVGVANGFSIPSAIAGSISVRPDIAGTASGISGSLQFGAYALGALVTGAALAFAPQALTLAAVMMAFTLLSGAASIWVYVSRG